MPLNVDALRLLRVREVHVAGFIEGQPPWRVRSNFKDQAITRFRGAPCWALLGSKDPTCIKVEDGDLFICLDETVATQIADAPQSQATGNEIPGEAYDAWPILIPKRLGGRGALTRMCGAAFALEALPRSVQAQLRPNLVIPLSEIAQHPMLAHLLDAFEAEVSARRDAQPVVIARLLESILVTALRCHGRQHSPLPKGLAQPSADRYLGKAFALLEEPGHASWNVGALASSVGLSRRALSRRFAQELGEAPRAHLTRRKMERAMELLRTTDLGVGEVAEWVGYESVAAFCRAFRRWQGASPMDYRKSCEAQGGQRGSSSFMP